MFKCIALLRRRRDITREQFIDYYENNHSKLMHRLLPNILEYRRNYIDLNGALFFPKAAELDFDVITELWFADKAAYDVFFARANEPEIFRQISEDEENLFDRDYTRMFVVDETQTQA